MKIHPLLEWQMAQCLPQNLQKSPEMEALLASVNESYHTLQPVARRHQMGVLDGETSQNHIVKTRVFQDFTRRWGKRIKSRIFSKEESGDKDAEQVLLQNPVLGKTLSAENEEMVLRTLGQNLPNPVFWIDHNGTIIFANNAFCQHIQYTQPWETLIGKSSDFILDLCGKLYKNEEKFIYRTKAHFSKQERINAERLEMVDERVMLRDFIPIFRDGEFRGAMVQYVDITKIILNEKGLKQAENFNSLILKASLSAIVMIDELGKIALWNPKSETIFGFTASEAMGFSFSELVFDASNREFFEAEMIKYKQTGDCAFVDRVADGWIRNKNHQMIEVGFYLVPIKQGYSNYFCAFFQDDSARKKMASDLKASQEIWQFALEGSGDGVWDWDFEGRQVYFSPQCKKILGYEAYEYMNTQEEWQTLLHPDDVEMLKGKTQEYVGNRIDSHSIEFRLKHKDGKYRWLLDRGKVMSYTPLGTPKRIIGYFQNITEKKKTEEALINSELQFRSLAENIPGLLFKYEHESSQSEGFLFVTSNPEAKIGMSKAELDNFYNYIHEDDLHRETLISKLARDKNIPYHFEGRFVFPDKKMIWLSISSSITGRNDHGGIITTGIMLNITKQKEAEQLLQLSEEKYRNIISNMNLGLLEVDLDGVIQTANQSFCEMSGYSMEEFLYKNASDFFLKKEYRIMMKEKTELRKKSYSDAYEVPIKVKSGEQKWWLISGAPSFNDSGQLIGSIGIHLDITNQKQLEMELKEAKRLADIAVSAKQQFLANMSHEIRTPMNVILGLTEQLQKSELGPQQHSFLKSVHAAADHLLLIINDVLDLTKVEEGKMVLEKIGFSPKKVFEKAFSLMRFKAESKGLRFTLSFSGEEISSVLLGDSHRINQVLINLMSNAIKFTHKGGVDIKIKVVVNDDNKQTLQISVADTGIGMEKEFSKQMFDMFSQEDSSVFRKFGGTGLGMSITKKLVNLMGGFISVDTEKGNGTTISFVLELEKGLMTSLETTEIIADYKQLLARKKVLMADDNEMNQLLAKTILSNVGIDVVVANNGVEALKNLKKDSFDLLLMDVHMPEMDGIEATRVIRHSVNKEIPIIALTAMAFKEDASLCLEAGMNDYLSKPFNENHLLAVVAKWTMKKEKGENLVEGIPVLDNGQAAKLYDLSRLREISKGDEAFMYKMIRLFITESTQGVNQMGLAYMKNDWAGIQKIAHRLKPSIENMGIYHLKDDMMELEMKAAVYQNNARMADLIAHVEKVISEVGLQLQQALGNEG